jgi:hypothetical protein
MTKCVVENLYKFYMCYEDAYWDVNKTFHLVEIEGGIPPLEDIKVVDTYINKIIDSEEQEHTKAALKDAVFKYKKITRETIMGTIIDEMYIFNNLIN